MRGVGVAAATGWLDGSGLELRDGVVCDAALQAAPQVFAAGDVARWRNELFGEEMRIEHWTNAAEQGAWAASNLLAASIGDELLPYAPVPFFWSDQFDQRLQFLGLSAPDDGRRGAPGGAPSSLHPNSGDYIMSWMPPPPPAGAPLRMARRSGLLLQYVHLPGLAHAVDGELHEVDPRGDLSS